MVNAQINVNWVPGITLEEMEKQCILAAFRFYRGNKTTTAQVLGIAIRTLDHKLDKYEADAARDTERTKDDEARRTALLKRLRGNPNPNYYNPVSQEGYPEQSPGVEIASVASESGVGVQPASEPAPQQAVSVSKRKKVQAVLPKKSSAHGSRRGR